MKKNPAQNLYATNQDNNKTYFIENVESGRKGYYCPGCGAELEAVIPKANIRPYFRHIATNVKVERKCTFSNETFRHNLAKSILLDIKKIKVPALYKYPPEGIDSTPLFLKSSHFISADEVSIEMPFYEDQNGTICWDKKIDNKDMSLLIQPDVTFFNSKGDPILFIELVATHKPDYDKLLKIKRLGIDTVQVIIPKSSPEDIEKAFSTTNHTKWLFNYEESKTEYIQAPGSYSERISSFDTDQRRLFTETVSCRSHQIRDLIRGIKRCLESEQYRVLESSIGSEISRVKRNTETNLEQLRRIQDSRREEVQDKYRSQRINLEERERNLEEKRSNLEGRYLKEKRRLEEAIREQQGIQREKSFGAEGIKRTIENERAALDNIRNMQAKVESKGNGFKETAKEIRRKFKNLTREEQEEFNLNEFRTGRSISDLREQEKTLPDRFRELTEQEQSSFEWDKEEELDYFTRTEEQTRRTTELLELEESELPKQFESDKEQLSREHHESRDRIRKKSEEEYAAIIREIEIGEVGHHGRLSPEIKKFIKAISLLDDIIEQREIFKRYEFAFNSIKEGTYKHWT